MAKGGFTQAELAAAEWAKHERKREKRKYRSLLSSPMSDHSTHRKRRHKRYDEHTKKKKNSRHSSVASSQTHSSTSSTIPKDPHNPLHEAHAVQSYYSKHRRRMISAKQHPRRRSRNSNRDRRCPSDSSVEEDISCLTKRRKIERWEHDVFENRSESPIRERTEGAMWDTRRGSWRSRAGGVYLPESPVENSEANESVTTGHQKPSRYKYPLRHQTNSSSFSRGIKKHFSPLRIPQSRGSPVYE